MIFHLKIGFTFITLYIYRGNLMKKLIFGAMLFCTGSLSAAILLAGSMANDWTLNGQSSALWNISRYGLLPALYIFLGLAVLGLVIVVWGLFNPEK